MLRVAIVGAGPIGLLVAKEITARPSLALHAVVDIDPNKRGNLVEGVAVSERIPDGADVAVITTTSSLAKLSPLVLDVVARKMHVVSTCEELAWPWSRRALADAIDAGARTAGVAVLGTGVNPGFVMDALPLLLTAPCQRVERVRVERVQDASPRRRPFQDKVGVGAQPAIFEAALAAGHAGHVGLAESAAMLAARLGFAVDGYVEEHTVVVADELVERAGRSVAKGQVLGVEQRARSTVGNVVVVELFFRAVFGEPASFDRILITGAPPLDVTIAGGVPGDGATAAIVANAISAVVAAKPGLRTMAEVPVAFSR